ncbi:MAG: restriction endonuclease subunit S [Ruminococcaceae bacterium]|nr:restriction endonuclease subunit S [Oscillospiraceae bacterium]
MTRLGDVGKVVTGNTPKTSDSQNYASNDICFIKPSDIADGIVSYLNDSEFYISKYARANARIAPPKSVLVTCIGIIGKVAINNMECAFNQQINTIIPDMSKCLTEYLAYAIQNKQLEMQDMANAPVVPILNKTQFSDIEINLPSLIEQKVIVEKMDVVSRLIALRKEQIAKLDQLVKSRFIELFGDVANSPKYSGVPLGTICSTLSGGTPTTKIPEYYQGDIPWISTPYLGNNHINGSSAKAYITEDAIKNSATHLIPANTIMFGIRVGVGKSSIIDEPMCANQDIVALIGIDTNKYNLLFVKHVLDGYQSHFDSIKKGATILGITTDDLKKVMIPVVEMELQNQFATFVEQTDKSKLVIQQSLNKLELLKESMMQKYFG